MSLINGLLSSFFSCDLNQMHEFKHYAWILVCEMHPSKVDKSLLDYSIRDENVKCDKIYKFFCNFWK